MKRWIKRIFGILAVAAFVAAIAYAFLPKPVPVDMTAVTRGDLQVYVEEDGKTRLRDRYTVSAPIAGRLLRIKLEPGDTVRPGENVAIIEPSDPALLDPRALAQAEARVKAAQANLEKATPSLEAAQASLDLAEAEYARAAELFKKNALAKTELDLKVMQKLTKAADYRAARHAQDVARFELELAQAALVHARPADSQSSVADKVQFEIPAPTLDGSARVFHVLRVFQESSVIVNTGTPLLELGDITDLEIEVDVLSSDAVRIRPGARVLLEQWGGEIPLTARVRLVEPYGFMKVSALGVEEQRVNVIADFDNRDKIPPALGDGYRVEAKIITWEKDDVLRVPTSALFRQGEGWAAFRVEQGRGMLRTVKVGRRNALYAEVEDGLDAGDQVVLHPSDKIVDGVLVTPR